MAQKLLRTDLVRRYRTNKYRKQQAEKLIRIKRTNSLRIRLNMELAREVLTEHIEQKAVTSLRPKTLHNLRVI